MTDLLPTNWPIYAAAGWLTIVVIAGIWLRSRERARERPIKEWTEEHYR